MSGDMQFQADLSCPAEGCRGVFRVGFEKPRAAIANGFYWGGVPCDSCRRTFSVRLAWNETRGPIDRDGDNDG